MVTNNCVVDVVVPYSPEHTPEWMLNKAINSIERQDIQTEIIIVRDEDQRGPAWARNRGLERSTNRYVAFLDADDRWKESKLLKQLRRMDEMGCGVCVEGDARSTERFIKDLILGELGSLTPSILVDTRQTDVRFNETLPRREDHLFLVQCAVSTGVCLVPDIVEVRKHEGGLTARNTPQVRREAAEKFARRVETILGSEWFGQYEDRYWSEFHYQQGRLKYWNTADLSALVSFFQSLRLHPQPKTVVALTAAIFGPIARWFESYR